MQIPIPEYNIHKFPNRKKAKTYVNKKFREMKKILLRQIDNDLCPEADIQVLIAFLLQLKEENCKKPMDKE